MKKTIIEITVESLLDDPISGLKDSSGFNSTRSEIIAIVKGLEEEVATLDDEIVELNEEIDKYK